jgi:hypothetical protein
MMAAAYGDGNHQYSSQYGSQNYNQESEEHEPSLGSKRPRSPRDDAAEAVAAAAGAAGAAAGAVKASSGIKQRGHWRRLAWRALQLTAKAAYLRPS